MEITWLGHSCFKIKGKKVTLITDPYDDSIGYTMGEHKADIVTLSHFHLGHCYVKGISGSPKVISSPGEYDVSGVAIKGIRTFHDAVKGEERGKNILYLIDIDDVRICHLGDLGHVLDAENASELSDVDILMVPVGGVSTIGASDAAEIARRLDPKIVIPMHYKTEALNSELDSIDKFRKEMGVKPDVMPEMKLVIGKSGLPQEAQVFIMDYQSKG
jgi:L-ascorbate metabolism protein UlaG (beta-lactamase superfamily)